MNIITGDLIIIKEKLSYTILEAREKSINMIEEAKKHTQCLD